MSKKLKLKKKKFNDYDTPLALVKSIKVHEQILVFIVIRVWLLTPTPKSV